MNLFSRIAIGTANWGREYNGAKVSEKDIEKILGYCQCSGIDTLDCATAYGWDWTQANSYFKKIIKVRYGDDIESLFQYNPYCIMAHGQEHWSYLNEYGLNNGFHSCYVGMSSYETIYDWTWFNVIQVPYSLYDRRFEFWFPQWKAMDIEIHVRSIFLRGKIIQDGIPAEECIKFCLCNPYVDKVIIGVDSFKQLQRNLDFLNKWNRLEKHDEKLLDPRQWE